MSYFLVASIIIAILAIIYVWYQTRGIHSIPDDKPLSLDTEEEKLLIHWYKIHTKPSFDFNINDHEIAAKCLRRLYNIELNPDLLVIGTNLETQYLKLTGTKLETKYNNGNHEFIPGTKLETKYNNGNHEFIPDTDYIVDIRSTLGKNVEIAVIHNSQIRTNLCRNNNSNLGEINAIIESDLDLVAREFLREVLKFRWDEISKLNDPNVLNADGSYLYLTPTDNTPYGTSTTVLGNVTAMMTPRGARINLVCSNLEFEALIKRWKLYRSTVTGIPGSRI